MLFFSEAITILACKLKQGFKCNITFKSIWLFDTNRWLWPSGMQRLQLFMQTLVGEANIPLANIKTNLYLRRRWAKPLFQCACTPFKNCEMAAMRIRTKTKKEMFSITMHIFYGEVCTLRTHNSLTAQISTFKKKKKNCPPSVISWCAAGWRPVFVEVECVKRSPKDAGDHRRVHHCATSPGRKSFGEGGWSSYISLRKQ